MTLQTPPEVLPIAKDLVDFLRELPIIKDVRLEEVQDDIFGRMTIVRAETKYLGKALAPAKRKVPINGPGGVQPTYEKGPVYLEYQIDGQTPNEGIFISNCVHPEPIGLLVRLGSSEIPIPLANIDLPKSNISTILESHKKVTAYLEQKYESAGALGYKYCPPQAIGPAA